MVVVVVVVVIGGVVWLLNVWMVIDWLLCRGRDLEETIQHLENFIEYENYDPENTDQSKLRFVPKSAHLSVYILYCLWTCSHCMYCRLWLLVVEHNTVCAWSITTCGPADEDKVQRTFVVAGPAAWNQLPCSVCNHPWTVSRWHWRHFYLRNA